MPPFLDVVLVDVVVENSGRVGGQIGVGGFAHPIPKQRPRASQHFPRDTNWTSILSVPTTSKKLAETRSL